MTNYFSTCTGVDEVKSLYRSLARANHPDLGGNTRTMQDINASYHDALKSYDGIKVGQYDNGKERVYRYHYQTEQSVVEKYADILRAKLPGRIVVEICGTWIWVSNTQKDDRTALKALKLLWHAKRIQWFWKPEGQYSRYNANMTNADIRNYYGSKILDKDTESAMVSV